MASGKLFRSAPARTNELRGVLYTNLDLVAPLHTDAGRLVPTNNLRERALVYELQEHMEHRPEAGVLVSRGIDPYLSDFAAVTAFGLNVVCTPDPNQKRRLLVGPPSATTGVMPKKFASTTFSERVYCKPYETNRFADFVGQLMGLKRRVFLDAMRAIRTYVTGMYRLGDDPDAAYTLLLSSLEPLLTHFDAGKPTWNDYPGNRRRPIDDVLRNADGKIQRDVREVLLREHKDAIGRRYRLFVKAHLDASFFREEASAAVSPVGRSELQRCLGHAYGLRSSYLHGSKGLPRELILGPSSRGETTRVGRGTILTFEGLSRLVRHIIPQFISRQESVPKEPYEYFREEPGTIQVELAPKYWMHRPGDFSAKAGRRRLFAFCDQIATAMRTNGPLEITDMREMLALVRNRLHSMRPTDRRPFIALYCLFNLIVPSDDRIDDNSGIVRSYRNDIGLPTIEAMLLALFTRSVPQWDLGDHERALRAYLDGRGRDRGIRMDSLLEAGLTLELAERYRRRGDADSASGLIRLALENHPGNQALMRFEREFDPANRIQWQAVMGLPNDMGSDDG